VGLFPKPLSLSGRAREARIVYQKLQTIEEEISCRPKKFPCPPNNPPKKLCICETEVEV
jgi:hypothetical protein